MKRFPIIAAAMAAALVWGCGKSQATKRAEVQNCSAITLDAPGISSCLVAQYRWKPAAAEAAGKARQHELDSVATHQRDSAWSMSNATHRRDLATCREHAADVARCLTDDYAWDPERASAAFDSIWHLDGRKHAQEVAACRRESKSPPGTCLQLHYKWDPQHAMAINDSLERARIRAMNK